MIVRREVSVGGPLPRLHRRRAGHRGHDAGAGVGVGGPARAARAPDPAAARDAPRPARSRRRPDAGRAPRSPGAHAAWVGGSGRPGGDPDGRPRTGGAHRPALLPARARSTRSSRSRTKTSSSAPPGRSWPMPTASSGSGRRRIRRCTRTSTPRCTVAVTGLEAARRTARRSMPRSSPTRRMRDGLKAQLDDLAFFLRQYVSDIEASPERLQEVEDRLALLERLKRKYGPTLADVRAHQQIAVRPVGGAAAARGAALGAAGRGRGRRRRLPDAGRGPCPPRGNARPRRSPRGCAVNSSDLSMPHADVSFRFQEATGEGEWTAVGHRPGRTAALGQSRRGAAAAGPRGVGRRAVAGDARRQGARRARGR